MKMAPVLSLAQLKCKVRRDANYVRLAMVAAENLGSKPTNIDEALHFLDVSANETDEEGVVEEINFCRALVGGE
jgi:hypothetical protein